MGQPHAIAVVGLGVILDAYLTTLADHPGVRIAAVADLDASRAATLADRLPGTRASTVEELLAADGIGTVLDLTTPRTTTATYRNCTLEHDLKEENHGSCPERPTSPDGDAAPRGGTHRRLGSRPGRMHRRRRR